MQPRLNFEICFGGKEMARNRKKREIKPFPKFEDAQPFDPDEFNTALNWYQNAALNIAKIKNPNEYGFGFETGDGNVENYGFTDIPLNRGMFALKERYGDDQDKLFSMIFRIQALFKIMHDEQIKKYMREGGEYTEVHPAVTDAAAFAIIGNDGFFTVDEFIKTVEELIHTKYKDDKSIN